MADKLADLSPEEKEKRIADMKAKMQASAQKTKAVPGAAAPPASAAKAEPVVAASAATTATAAVVVAATPPEAKAAGAPTSNGAATNGAAAAVALAPSVGNGEPVIVVETPEQQAKKAMNRREFLTYAWGGALALLAVEAGVGTFFFMYPRFKAGEFGGSFVVGPEASLPPTDAAPSPFVAGKFWLVNVAEEGPKALYMVCTHLGCLYKWAQSNNRFECPCHGSKFDREGYYIEGPAPRSLDTFLVTVDAGMVTVDTGKKTLGEPAVDSPARAVPV